jgi:hypothetical protein
MCTPDFISFSMPHCPRKLGNYVGNWNLVKTQFSDANGTHPKVLIHKSRNGAHSLSI